MRFFIVPFLLLGLAVCVVAIEVGDEAPALNRPEVVTPGGGYGSNINIDDLIADGKTILVSFGYDT